MMSARIVIRKSRDGHRFPWAATYPCCKFMNSATGHGWPTWESVMARVAVHLRELHSDAYREPPAELLQSLYHRSVGEVPWFRHPDGPEANGQDT